MIRSMACGLACATLVACTPPAATNVAAGPGEAAAQTTGAPAGAEEAITAWYREQLGANLIEPVAIFYGDFTGDGAADALSWGNFDTGGSGGDHMIALFHNDGGRMAHFRTDQSVLGSTPRNVQFAQGRITLTTTMPRPGDPHCCPTGEQNWTIEAE